MPETEGGQRRRLLPMLGGVHGGRSAMTCKYRCADACFHPVPNESDNEYFGDMVEKAMSRRGLLRSGAVAALVVGSGVGGSALAAAAAPARPDVTASGPKPPNPSFPDLPERGRPVGFRSVGDNTLDTIVVPNGYDWSVTVAWGDPILPGAPEFDFDNQTEAAQLGQFGYNCDFVAILPLDRDFTKGLLWVNHEYTNEELMFRGWTGAAGITLEQLKVVQAAHGGSVVELERVAETGEWLPVGGRRRYNRRIHTKTEFLVTGPVAGSDLLKTSADKTGKKILGMLNNCAGGTTPWGTILSGEENFNQYFGSSAAITDPTVAARYARYGLRTTAGTERNWEKGDKRFDLAQEPNEPNRFGWIVEIDPFDPESTPRKHTALGRMKHEGATISIAEDGRAVAYMGDDERFDYVYKFISKNKFRPGDSKRDRDSNLRLLEEGDLYVAKFTGDSPAAEIDGTGKVPSDGAFDGTGQWIPLVVNGQSKVQGMTVAEVLTFTRLAGDRVGATKMDRPEDVERNPVTGTIVIALTNNTSRNATTGADETNPRFANKWGHVVGIDETGNDAAAMTFTWNIIMLAGDPNDASTYYGGFDKTQVSHLSCPDNVAFDPAGRLWISTDGMPSASGIADGLFVVPVEGPDKGHVRRFASVPRNAECCGPFITPDGRTATIAVQHPGEGGTASPENPISTFPYGDQPRPSVVTVWRKSPGNGPFIGD
ncbi:PhoX family protein [Jiangella mangrovi]|uniref:Secreted PhoX family phosphatase n=1 Tax=Jiangella mangrovi TaxID=1524084 RepID=A0A7W9GXU0_9ACTN|nr:PhoX family phosphatase [Jiangella mangrovi]MBB5792004.1 secreted PhoX family phosphatase [Jiangella mangrovi]